VGTLICFGPGLIMILIGIVLLIITTIIGIGKGAHSLATKKKCPYCREKIPRKAKWCKYCGRTLFQDFNRQRDTQNYQQTNVNTVSSEPLPPSQQEHQQPSKPVISSEVRSKKLSRKRVKKKKASARICPSCRKGIDGEWITCGYCGKRLLKRCPECDQKMPLDFDMCKNCGYEYTFVCSSCGKEIKQSYKDNLVYCPECGKELE